MYNNQLRKLFAQGSFELKVLISCYPFVCTVSLCEMGRFKSDRLKRDYFFLLALKLNSMQKWFYFCANNSKFVRFSANEMTQLQKEKEFSAPKK